MSDTVSVDQGTRRGIRLQTRLLLLVLLVAGAALLAVGVALPTALNRWLLQDKDNELIQAAHQLTYRQTLQPPGQSVQSSIGLVVFDAAGQVALLVAPAGADPQAHPSLEANPRTGIETSPASGTHAQLRTIGIALPSGYFGYIWTPLPDTSATVERVVLLEIAASAVILLFLGLVTRRLLRRQLSPLLEITATARANSIDGSNNRVVIASAAPEVIDLGRAFNSMLDSVEVAAAAQSRTDNRLRRFITDASHDLRTPLAAILGYGEMYQRRMITTPTAIDNAVDRMVAEADRMRALVTALISLTDDQEPPPSRLRPVDLAALTRTAAQSWAEGPPERRFEFETYGAAWVSGNESRLYEAVITVLDNITRHATSSALTVITVIRVRDDVRMTVDDDGPGVSRESMPHLFDRFYRTDESRSRLTGGAGLGLAIVQAIAEAHRGRATAAPSPLGGLRIELTFPAATEVAVDNGSVDASSRPSGSDGLSS